MSLDNIKIKSNLRDYETSFISNINKVLKNYKDCHSIIDKKVYNLYKDKIDFPDENKRIKLEANEHTKSLDNLDKIIQQLLKNKIKRSNKLIVIGGGTIQDTASFISSILFRGLPWIFFPTTLLAQCDSCIGSKTSINFKKYKNQLGTFYPAEKIYVYTDILKTLSKNDILSGIGEIIKIYYIEGNHISNLKKSLKEKDFEEMIYKSLIFKKHFIEIDEFDKKERNILNYGHTLGHALETLTNYEVPHGQAVLLGADFANFLSYKMDYLPYEEYKDMKENMKEYLPEVNLEKIEISELIDALKKDKKNVSGKLSYILTSGYGKMFKEQIEYDIIKKNLKEYIDLTKENQVK